MSNKYDHGYGRGWGNWHGWNGWNGYNAHHAQNGYHGPNGWSWGYWKGHHQNPNWGYYSHYQHVPRRFGCFKKLFVIGLAFWAGSAYTRNCLEGGHRKKCGENKPVGQPIDQTASVNQVSQVASVNQATQAPPVQQQSQSHQNEFDYRKSWMSWRKCRSENTQFLQCLNNNNGEIGACQPFFDLMKECENRNL